MNKKYVCLLFLLIIALALIIFSFFTPWYSTYQGDIDSIEYVNLNFYLKNAHYKGVVNGETINQKINYDILKEYSTDNVLYVYDIAFYFSIISLIFCIIAIILLIILVMIKNTKLLINNYTKDLISGTIILTFVIVIIFTIILAVYQKVTSSQYFYTELSGKINFWSSFTYEYSGTTYSFTSGPGLSWYFMLISGIICIPAYLLIKRAFTFNGLQRNNYLFQNPKKEEFRYQTPQSYYPTEEPTVEWKYCNNCGSITNNKSKYCSQCGNKLFKDNK